MSASNHDDENAVPLALTPPEFFAEVMAGVAAGWCPINDAPRWIATAVINEDSAPHRLEVIGLLDQFEDCVTGIRLHVEFLVAAKLTRMYRPQDTEDAGAL